MSGKRTLVRATAGMALVTVASRLCGLLRDKVLAAVLGPSGIGDAYTVGFRAPNLFRQLFAEGALQATFVPTLASLQREEKHREAARFVGAMLSTLLLLLAVVVAAGMLGAEPFAAALAPAYRETPEKFALTVHFTRSFFPYLAFVSLAAFLQGVLNVRGRFLLGAGTPIAFSLVLSAAVLFAHWRKLPLPPWVVAGVLVGGFLQFLVLWVHCLRLGLPVFPAKGAFTDPHVRQVLRKAVPLLFSAGIYPLTVFLSTNFASRAGEGAVFCLYVASRLTEIVYGVVVVQLFTALLPTLAASRDRGETLGFALRFQSLVVFPSMFFLLALPRPVVGLLFGGGRFAPWAVELAAAMLVFLALGMPALALSKLAAGSFYAHHETRQPVLAAVLSLASFALFGVALLPVLQGPGVALALAGSQYVGALWLWWQLKRRGWLEDGQLLQRVSRHALAAAGMAAVLSGLARAVPVPPVTSWVTGAFVGFCGVFGLGVYVALLWLFRAPEIGEVRQALRRGGR